MLGKREIIDLSTEEEPVVTQPKRKRVTPLEHKLNTDIKMWKSLKDPPEKMIKRFEKMQRDLAIGNIPSCVYQVLIQRPIQPWPEELHGGFHSQLEDAHLIVEKAQSDGYIAKIIERDTYKDLTPMDVAHIDRWTYSLDHCSISLNQDQPD
jgi:hypothetical protein